MTASHLTLDILRSELLDRLSQTEQRTQALEAMLLLEREPFRKSAPLHETPTPTGNETPRRPLKLAKPLELSPRTESVPAAVIASLDDAIWSTTPDGERVYVLAGGVERTFGRPAQDFLERPGLWFDIVPEDDRASLRAAFRQLTHTGQFQIEHAIKTPSGAARWVASRAKLVRSDNGLPLRVDGITTDVSARTRTERTGLAILEAIGPLTGQSFLEAAVEQLAKGFNSRAAVVAIPDPVEPHAAHTVAAWIDGRLAESFAFPVHGRFVRDVLAGGSQFVPVAARDRFPSDEFLNRLRAEAAAAVPLVDAAGKLLGFVAVVDDRSVRGDPPDVRTVLRALAPRIAAAFWEGEAPAEPWAKARQEPRPPEGQSLDHPARIRELEARLAIAEAQSGEAARLELVGRLLAGAAHDFNNLLTIVTGHAELVRENLMPNDPLCEPVELIASSGHTAARVARQLLAYARPAEAEPSALDPNSAIRESERTLRRFAGERVELDFLLTPGVAPIRADRSEFDRVVLNLVVNARDAIEDTGLITVRTATANVASDRRGWPAECAPGEYVALTVADTGCGMTDDVKERAFTRFFTTKGSKGSGLGLATVRDIVRAGGGHIEVESSPEWGTSIRVFWPAAKDDDE